jgi:hypothetical protein
MSNQAAAPTIQNADSCGTRDGNGAGDHDAPYQFGRRPSVTAPFPFTTRQYVRLMILRSRIQDGALGAEDCEDAHPLVFLPDGVWLASATDLLVANR